VNCTTNGGKEQQQQTHRRWVEMHFPRSEMRKKKQNQKRKEKGPEPNATNTSLPPIAVMGAANAHITASNIYQQKLDLIRKVSQRKCAGDTTSCLYTKA